jgi:hypothetical protein
VTNRLQLAPLAAARLLVARRSAAHCGQQRRPAPPISCCRGSDSDATCEANRGDDINAFGMTVAYKPNTWYWFVVAPVDETMNPSIRLTVTAGPAYSPPPPPRPPSPPAAEAAGTWEKPIDIDLPYDSTLADTIRSTVRWYRWPPVV